MVGIGNFGKVYKAYNKFEGRDCALKILKKEGVAAMKHVDHIINEREILFFLTDRQEEEKEQEQCPFIMRIFSTF